MSNNNGDMSFQGANYEAQQEFTVHLNYPYGDTTVVGQLSPGIFRFNYLAGIYPPSASFSVELIIEPAEAARSRSNIRVSKTSR
jgi:hypothetical protein